MERASRALRLQGSFSDLARRVADEAHRQGLAAPSFRTPPQVPGADRTLRRYAEGHCLVSVRWLGRPLAEVADDMVEGVALANGLAGESARRWRVTARSALSGSVARVA